MSSSSLQQEEWKKSQDRFFSIDLVAAAESELKFLLEVHCHPEFFSVEVLERAIERYEYCWLPLADSFGVDSGLVPPLDCAWIWHCHKLNHVQYAKDCKRLFGRIVEVQVDLKNRKTSLDVWKQRFPEEPYTLELTGNMSRKQKTSITYDLINASSRQREFFYQVSEPHYNDPSFLAAAEQRYKAFLYLISRQDSQGSTLLVPTYDIELIWQAHQLDSLSYARDVREVSSGNYKNHVQVAGEKLDVADTCKLWEDSYGFPYEKAGCMYRDERGIVFKEATFPGTDNLSSLSNEWLIRQRTHLTLRKIVKIQLSVRGVKGVPDAKTCFVTLKAIKNFEALKVQTEEAAAVWNQTWTFESELATEGVVLELRSSRQRYSIRRLLTDFKLVGDFAIYWRKVKDSEMQSLNGWFPLENTKSGTPPLLQVFVSVTPPVTGPYLLRSVRARDTGDDQATFHTHKKGMWITRTVHDHANDEVYVTRTRYKLGGFWSFKNLPTGDKVIHVHHGGWAYTSGTLNGGTVSGEVLGSGIELSESAWDVRKWSLLNGRVLLTVGKDREDLEKPALDVSGEFRIVLFPGLKFEFASRAISEKQQASFVTMVTYTKAAPQGKVAALFNWKSGLMQIEASENVVLVVLLMEAIATSMSDLLGKEIVSTMKSRRLAESTKQFSDHLGGVRDLSGGVVGNRPETRLTEGCQPWWTASLSSSGDGGDDGD